MIPTLLIRPFIIVSSDRDGCSADGKKKKCCNKYRKKGKSNCKRCPKL
ncbi:MAG: ferric iron reductase protein FhuF [Maribacter sp.]|jgi:ferric iron reductase protein FhuF